MSVTLSPIYAHFSETLTGLATIRAFRDEARFKQENEQRLEIKQRANFCGKKIRLRKVLAGMVTSFTETEKQMVSVERAVQYVEDVQPEISLRSTVSINHKWLVFHNCLRYLIFFSATIRRGSCT